MPKLQGSRGILLNLPGSMLVRASDDFTDTDLVALATHNAAWIKHPSSTNTADPSINTNRVRNETAATTSVYTRNDFVPVSADYDVRAGVVVRSATAGFASGVIGRCDAAAATYYLWRYVTATPGWELFKIVAGVGQLLGSFGQTLTIDQEYVATLQMRGSRISAYVDGVQLVSVTDTQIAAAGSAGLRLQASMTATTGIHLDTWKAIQ